MGDFPYVEWLSRLYKNRGDNSGLWTDYLKAHGLANFCVSKDTTEERCELVYAIEDSWYNGEHPLSYVEHQELTAKHKDLLRNYRNHVSNDFETLMEEGNALDFKDVFNEENMNQARAFCEHIFGASKRCSDEFVTVSKFIIDSNVNVLRRLGMLPPCSFAVIGLGSVAKGEATPYSDLEFAFVVEHDDVYFKNLAMESYFRIGNLGESPLKTFDIVELKVKKGSPPIIYDDGTVGYRIDGITEKAGNIPTGNGRAEGQTLTLTVKGFMEMYKMSAETPFDGVMAGDKADMLSSGVLIYTNEAGNKSQLYEQFTDARMLYEATDAKFNHTISGKRLDSFAHDVRSYQFLPEFANYRPPANLDIKIKTDIFRYPTLLANNIKVCLGMNLAYPWDTFTHLCKKGVLSEQNLGYLKIVLALSIYLRTSAYLSSNSQMESVSLDPYLKGPSKLVYQLPVNLFIILGCLLIPIKQSIKCDLENVKKSCNMSSISLDNIVTVLLRNLCIHNANPLLKAEVCYFAGVYDVAQDELSKVIGVPLESVGFSNFRERIQQMSMDSNTVLKYVELCSYLLYYTNNYASVVDYFNWIVNRRPDNKGFWKLVLSHCKKQNGDLKASRLLLDEAKQCLEESEDSKSHHSIHFMELMYGADNIHPDVSSDYNSVGNVYLAMGEYGEALRYHAKWLKICLTMYGDASHSRIAACYNNIGYTYTGLGKYVLALECHKKSLAIALSLYGVDRNHPYMANSYLNSGISYAHLGKYTSALDSLNKSVEMMKAIYGADTNHPDIANCYNNLGIVYNLLGEHKLTLKYHLKGLDMRKAIYGANSNHPDIAVSCTNMGNVYIKEGQYTSALQYYTRSLEMRKAIFGADTKHPAIATCYNNIGATYNYLGEYALALEHYTNGLEMRKNIYGADANHPEISSSYNNVGNAYTYLGEFNLALKYYMKGLKMRKAIYGAKSNHANIANSYHNVGTAFSKLGEYTSALEYYNKSAEMKEAIYGADSNHVNIATTIHNIGSVYSKLGKYESSIEYYTKSLEMRKIRYGTDFNHPDIADSYYNIGEANSNLCDYPLALEYFMKSLEMSKAVYGVESNHPDIVRCSKYIAKTYRDLGNIQKATVYETKCDG